jgi:hypothetical protein
VGDHEPQVEHGVVEYLDHARGAQQAN